jgi:hypothetical protein
MVGQTFRFSLNRLEADRTNVIERLEAKGTDNSVATAEFMRFDNLTAES